LEAAQAIDLKSTVSGLVDLSPALPDIKRDEANGDNRRDDCDRQRPIEMLSRVASNCQNGDQGLQPDFTHVVRPGFWWSLGFDIRFMSLWSGGSKCQTPSAKARWLEVDSPPCFDLSFKRDLRANAFSRLSPGKPVPSFPDHALAPLGWTAAAFSRPRIAGCRCGACSAGK
jgi:hypothetical protein